MSVELVEFTDPACSYAWGTEPKVRRLRWQYGHRLRWRRVMMGMHAPGWESGHYERSIDDPALAQDVSDYWAGVGALTGMSFPSPLHHVHVATEPACLLIKAAERQDGSEPGPGGGPSDRLLRRMRESWFVFGRPADTVERGLELAADIADVAGLDVDRLARDVEDPAVAAAFRADWTESRRPNADVLTKPDKRVGFGAAQPSGDGMRFGLPCMILTGPCGEVTVSGWTDWAEWAAALETAAPGITADAHPLPTPQEAFATWPLLARPEVEMLCGPDAVPPSDAVRHAWPGGVVWVAAAAVAALS